MTGPEISVLRGVLTLLLVFAIGVGCGALVYAVGLALERREARRAAAWRAARARQEGVTAFTDRTPRRDPDPDGGRA